MTGAVTLPSAGHWAKRIRRAWQSTLEGIFETGRLLNAAKDVLAHGDWLEMVGRDLPFSAGTAQRLMRIALDPRLSDAAHGPLLPPSWRTLYELTRLPDDALEVSFADGTIHPEMQRADISTRLKKQRRHRREIELGERIVAAADELAGLAPVYGVIHADPPWIFEPWSHETGMDRAAGNHYPTSPLADLVKLQPPAAKHAALFLWTTAPMLSDALDLMAAWSFGYRTHMIWRKQRPGAGRGTGYWVTGEHELLLIGRRGNVPAPAPGEQPPSVVDAPVGPHSAKPEIFREIIEQMFPSLPKLEMFSRSDRPGWTHWGAEAPESEAA